RAAISPTRAGRAADPGGWPATAPGARLDWPRGHMAAIGRENYRRAILMRCSFVKRTYLGHYCPNALRPPTRLNESCVT
ncbi:MAG: hypothetical protein KGL54_15375, partial [Sphingomonadales bacterium]|nr:hypothetical protein [Sphingomonadales bacterium]